MRTSERPHVVYWNNIPTPYVVGRFNALAARGNLAFEAWFNERQGSDRSWDVEEAHWRFPARYIPTRRVAGREFQVPVPELQDVRPDLLVSLHATPSFAVGSFAARAAGARTAFRVLPTYDAWVRRSRIKEEVKHFVFRTVDGVKVPGADGARSVRRYGVPGNRIHRVTQSIDVEHFGSALAMSPATRTQLRKELGVFGCVFAYVGRLWSAKGLDYLFEAFRSLREERSDVSLLIVGDGIDEARYRTMAEQISGVAFAGFVQPRDLPQYYALADVLVFPTLGDPHGLVVEEAMAAGLPVICTEAAGDIRRRLPDGRAGYVVHPADAAHLADRMRRLAVDAELRRCLGAEARRLVANRAHEHWAIDFETFVDRVLSMPPRRSPQALLARAIGTTVLSTGGDNRALAPIVGSQVTKEHGR